MPAQKTKTSRQLLNQETDARFWVQTRYNVGQPLNMKDATDRAMAKAWHDIFLSVQQEDREGRLKVTYNDPVVQALIRDATTATDAARGHLAASAVAPDPATAQAHAVAAAAADQVASAAAKQAAARQPPTVSPLVVQAAAAEAAKALGRPPPDSVVYDLPPDHPAKASPAARPLLPVRAIVTPLPATARSPHLEEVALTPHPPPRDPLAEARAQKAPAVAVAVHEDRAKTRPRGRGSEPQGTTPPGILAKIRGGAADTARKAQGDFVGVTLSTSGGWVASTFSTPGEAAAWYGDYTDDPTRYQYAAYYDKTDGATWPAPVEETLGQSTGPHREIPVRVTVDRPPPRPLKLPRPPPPAPAPPAGPVRDFFEDAPPSSEPAREGERKRDLVVPILIGGAALFGLVAIAVSSSDPPRRRS